MASTNIVLRGGRLYQSLDIEELTTDTEAEEPTTEDLTDLVTHTIIDGSSEDMPSEFDASAEDRDFALWCLLKECHEIREHLRVLWRRYHGGKVSIRVAADVTDRAFLIIIHAVEGYTKEFPELSTFEKVADYLDLTASIRGKSIEGFRYRNSSAGPDEPTGS